MNYLFTINSSHLLLKHCIAVGVDKPFKTKLVVFVCPNIQLMSILIYIYNN